MNEDNLKEKTAKGLIWGGLSNGATQVIGALLGIIMLRILSPDDYGKIAVLLIYSNIAANLQDSGFTSALINIKEPTHEQYNSVFWFNILVSTSIYVVLWFASPFIADFNHDPSLTPLARFLFLSFVINSLGLVQRAYLVGHLKVKQNSIIGLVALIISNTTGLILALLGFAYWGLATQSVLYIAIVSICVWHYSPWRPSFHFDLKPALAMFGFSSKILATNLFNQLNTHVFSFLLGHYYNGRMTGLYSNARKWNDMAAYTINGMMNSVSQPVLAHVVDDDARYRAVFRKMLRFASFVCFPCMLGLALISREFILITVDEKWAESAPMLSMLCLHGAFMPISELYSRMSVSRGRSGVNMFCTITLCLLVWAGLFMMKSLGIYHMIVYFVGINLMWLAVWQWFAWRMFRLRFIDAVKDVMPFFLLAAVVMTATYYATMSIENIYLCIMAKIIMAAVLYVGLLYASGAVILREAINYVRKR